ncbi:MAG: c-type cytochrome [Gammaproteobacteria bacterium]
MNPVTTLLIAVSAVTLLACGPSDTAPPATESPVADSADAGPAVAPPLLDTPAVEPFPEAAAPAESVDAVPAAPITASPTAPAPSQPAAPAPAPVAPATSAPAADLVHGQQIYRQACAFCHDKGVAGAPKIGDAAIWGPRLAQGMDALYTASLRGKGAMPAKGGNAALSDGDVKAAVDYMVAQSR